MIHLAAGRPRCRTRSGRPDLNPVPIDDDDDTDMCEMYFGVLSGIIS